MALYDSNFDWYDLFVPGSQITPMFGNEPNAATDIADAIGIGTQRRAQNFNSAEAIKQREWEEKMDKTKYQRAIEDIKAAGLNPSMLYANGGNVSSVPSGASGSSGIQSATNIVGQIGQIINSVNSARSLDYKMKHNEMKGETTQEIYNGAGELLQKVITGKLIKK